MVVFPIKTPSRFDRAILLIPSKLKTVHDYLLLFSRTDKPVAVQILVVYPSRPCVLSVLSAPSACLRSLLTAENYVFHSQSRHCSDCTSECEERTGDYCISLSTILSSLHFGVTFHVQALLKLVQCTTLQMQEWVTMCAGECLSWKVITTRCIKPWTILSGNKLNGSVIGGRYWYMYVKCSFTFNLIGLAI